MGQGHDDRVVEKLSYKSADIIVVVLIVRAGLLLLLLLLLLLGTRGRDGRRASTVDEDEIVVDLLERLVRLLDVVAAFDGVAAV